MKLLKVTTDLEFSIIEVAENDRFFNSMVYREIKCDLYEVVHTRVLQYMVPGKKTCMLVDEEGLLKDTVVVNLFASVFYGTSTDIIAGDVIFLNEDGEDFAGLTDEQIKWFDAQYKKCCEVSGRKYECLYS